MSGSKSFPHLENVQNRSSEPVLDEAVSFTVHTMPRVSSQELRDKASTRSGRIKMLLLLLVSAAPVLASYFTYYVVRPEGRRNHGELIDPQRALPNVVAIALDGSTLQLPALKGQWLLMTVAGGACNAQCEKNLYLSRQLREALGKDKARVDWVWLRNDTADVPPGLRSAVSTATVLQVPAADVAAWLQPADGQALTDHLYVIDPLGHWMMRFPAESDAKKMLKDLERLMRGSASWDLAGRP